MRGGPAVWLDIAEAIASVIEQVVADPTHPWARRWPTARELAVLFDTTQPTVLKALNHLGEQGLMVKARVPTRGSAFPRPMWVPQDWASAFPDITQDQIAEQLLAKGLSGQWKVLPDQRELADQFGVGHGTIGTVTQRLAQRGQAVKVRIRGQYRWRIVPPRVRGVDPRSARPSTVPLPQAVVADLLRRIRAGEFRYRLPGCDTVHERPFLANRELGEQYGVSWWTTTKVKEELRRRGLIVPGTRSNAPYRLAAHVPLVDRTSHPAPMPMRTPPPRARQVADDLITRIRDGEFFVSQPPRVDDVITEYRVGRFTAQAVLDLLDWEGWITFRYVGQRRHAVLADPLPQQPGTGTTAIPIDNRVANRGPAGTPRSVTAAIISALAILARPVTLAQLCQATTIDVTVAEARLRQLVEHGWVRRFDHAGGPVYTLDAEGRDVAETMAKPLMGDRARPSRPSVVDGLNVVVSQGEQERGPL